MTPYVEQFIGFFHYFIAVLFVLIVLSIVGKSCLTFFKISRKSQTWNSERLLAPAIGAAVLSLPMVVVAHHGIGVSGRIVWASVFVLSLPQLIRCFRTFSSESFSIRRIRSELSKWKFLPIATVIGLVPYLQLFVKAEFPVRFGTSATWTNNDLGAYIQMATNVSNAGIRDAGLVTGWNAGLQASFDHPSAHTFFATVAQILNRQPYQVGIVLMATVISMMVLAATFLIRRISKSEGLPLILISTLVAINPPVVASVCNFFYPQLFSISLVLAYAGLVLIFANDIQLKFTPLLLALLATAIFLISVEIAAILIPLVGIFVLMICQKNLRRKLVINVVGGQVIIFGIFLIFERDLFMSQFEVLTKLSASGVAGWRANFVSPSMVFGLAPAQFSGPYTSGIRLLDALFLITLFVVSVVKVIQNRGNFPLATAIVTLLGLVLLAVKRWGIDGYQTWKLITALTPMFMVLILSILLITRNNKNSVSALAISMFTVGATFTWSADVWNDGQSTSYINEDLAQILTLDRTSNQTGLNILLAPFFETMAASVISGAPSRMASPNYYFFEGQEILYRCTVTTTDKLSLLQNHGPIVARQGQYVVVGTPACD